MAEHGGRLRFRQPTGRTAKPDRGLRKRLRQQEAENARLRQRWMFETLETLMRLARGVPSWSPWTSPMSKRPMGLRVLIRCSKTDQEGQRQAIAIARGSVACPVKALAAWFGAASRARGARGCEFRRPFAAQRLPDQRRPPRCLGVQDARRIAAQVNGRAARLRARRRAVPRPCRSRTALIRPLIGAEKNAYQPPKAGPHQESATDVDAAL
jgi:hypothetical protein